MSADLSKYDLPALENELQRVNKWLKWSASLVSKQGGWIMWNGDKHDENERYAKEIKKEIEVRKNVNNRTKVGEVVYILPDNYITFYNGQEVKWAIGDVNFFRAEELGCVTESYRDAIIYKSFLGIKWSKKIKSKGRGASGSGAYWEAWGSCNGHAYQLSAWFNRETRELSEVKVCAPTYKEEQADGTMLEKPSHYFHQETYDLLTQVIK